MTNAQRLLLTTGAALGLIGASAAVRIDPFVIWNATASVPIGFYIVMPIREPKVGDLVAVRAPAPLERWLVDNGYIGGDAPLLKRVAGLAGAEVCRDGTTIRINGNAVAEAHGRDRLGRLLPVWRGCRRLWDGEVFFLNAQEAASLDGRYFGPLGTDTIIGRATPLWTRRR